MPPRFQCRRQSFESFKEFKGRRRSNADYLVASDVCAHGAHFGIGPTVFFADLAFAAMSETEDQLTVTSADGAVSGSELLATATSFMPSAVSLRQSLSESGRLPAMPIGNHNVLYDSQQVTGARSVLLYWFVRHASRRQNSTGRGSPENISKPML